MEIESSLKRVEKISKFVYYLFTVFFWLYLILLVAGAGLGLASLLFLHGDSAGFSSSWLDLLTFAVTGVPNLLIVKTIANIFRDIGKGNSPFSKQQVRRIRWIAIFILIGALIDFLLSTPIVTALTNEIMSFGYVSHVAMQNNFVSINLSAVFMALVLFCLSLAFEYGTLLQQLSDETL